MCHVYFIDDEPDLRLASEQSFELADIDAQFFPDAESALIAIQEHGLPHMIITDICLPGLSGHDLLNTVIHKDKELPVIMINRARRHLNGSQIDS